MFPPPRTKHFGYAPGVVTVSPCFRALFSSSRARGSNRKLGHCLTLLCILFVLFCSSTLLYRTVLLHQLTSVFVHNTTYFTRMSTYIYSLADCRAASMRVLGLVSNVQPIIHETTQFIIYKFKNARYIHYTNNFFIDTRK